MNSIQEKSRRTLVFGGTGFLGYYLAQELASHREEVVLFGRGTFSTAAKTQLPDNVRVQRGDIGGMTASELRELVEVYDEIVYAAGADDRRLVNLEKYASPAAYFHEQNVGLLERVLTASMGRRIQSFVLYNSYFATHARLHPEWRLTEKHPYIASRVAQVRLIEKYAADWPGVSFGILEIPFVMGATPGHPSLFAPLVQSLRRMPVFFVFPGKTVLITAQDVARATRIALTRPPSSVYVPLETYGIEWSAWIKEILRCMHVRRPVAVLPLAMFKAGCHLGHLGLRLSGKGSGLDLRVLMDFLGQDLSLPGGKDAAEGLPPEMMDAIRDLVASEALL